MPVKVRKISENRHSERQRPRAA